MSARVADRRLFVTFEHKQTYSRNLPDPSDKAGLKQAFDEAEARARQHGAATRGQVDAIRKALNEAGYHLIGPGELCP